MKQADVLVYDVGTSSLKLVLYGRDGSVLAQKAVSYSYQTPKAEWAEIDPAVLRDALWQGLEEFGQEGLLGALRAISGTGQMHTAVLLDEAGDTLSPSILWLDRRAEQETVELEAMFHLPPYMLNTTYTLPKLYWMKKHLPELMEKLRYILWPKDYIRYVLTGVISTEATEGIGAALLNWEKGAWAPERLEQVGISPSILPPIHPSDAAVGTVLPEIRAKYGMPQDVKVYSGFGDIVALLGGAPHQKGRLVYSLGSSAMYFTAVDQPNKTAENDSLYTLELGGYHLFGGVTSTAGASPMWYFETLWGGGDFSEMAGQAWTVEPGCGGLVFIPYLAGERSPYWSDRIAGGFYGVRLQHGKKEFARAVFEGVAYSIRHVLDLCRASGVEITELALAAGGVRTAGWPELIADICQIPVRIFAGQDTVAKVVYAMCRGQLDNQGFDDVLLQSFEAPRSIQPKSGSSAAYDAAYRRYRKFSSFAAQCDDNGSAANP